MYIIYGAGRHPRYEHRPLLRHQFARHTREIVVRVRTREAYKVCQSIHLSGRVGGESLVEAQEMRIFMLGKRHQRHAKHLPKSE